MKTLTTILMCLLALISLAGCFEEQSFWAYGDDDALGVRLGTEVYENVEVGASSMWWPENDNDTQLYGAYALYHLPSDDEDIVCTYVGVQTPLNNTYYDQVAPVVGVVFDKIFFTEFQYRNWDAKESQEEDKVVFGVRFKF